MFECVLRRCNSAVACHKGRASGYGRSGYGISPLRGGDSTSDYVTGKTAEQHSGEDKIHERNELDADILLDFRRKWDTTMNKMVEEFDVLFVRITGAGFVA